MRLEGGLPIKRFVVGNDITPNISKTIGTNCVPDEFDFLEIIVNDDEELKVVDLIEFNKKGKIISIKAFKG